MHKPRSIQKWFVGISVEELDWPAQSPDLNPFEDFWDELNRRLRTRSNHPTSVLDLTNALVAEWKQVPSAMFQRLVESLPRRVEAVRAAMFQRLVESLPRRVEAVIASMFQHLEESFPRRVEAVRA